MTMPFFQRMPDQGLKWTLLALTVAVSTSCTSLSPQQHAAGNTMQPSAVGLSSEPLSQESAVDWMLLHSPQMQALLTAEIREQGEIRQQGRLANPGLTLARLKRGGETEIERAISVDLLGILSLPARMKLSDRQLERSRLQSRIRLMQQVLKVRLAWIEAVAAGQRARYAGDVAETAQAAHELALRMKSAGSLSQLDSGRETAFWLESGLMKERGRQQARLAREKLALVMGVADPSGMTLPTQLPALPEAATPSEIPTDLTAERLDILAARADTLALASNLKLGKATRFVNVLELGLKSNRADGQPEQRGAEIRLELPLFDFGRTRVRNAELQYRQALEEAAQTALNAHREYRSARADIESGWAAARIYRDELIPLQKQLLDEVLLRYNGMLADTFTVLTQSREQIRTLNDGLDAQERYWKSAAVFTHVKTAPLPAGDQP